MKIELKILAQSGCPYISCEQHLKWIPKTLCFHSILVWQGGRARPSSVCAWWAQPTRCSSEQNGPAALLWSSHWHGFVPKLLEHSFSFKAEFLAACKVKDAFTLWERPSYRNMECFSVVKLPSWMTGEQWMPLISAFVTGFFFLRVLKYSSAQVRMSCSGWVSQSEWKTGWTCVGACLILYTSAGNKKYPRDPYWD